jgi:hypothetical protein
MKKLLLLLLLIPNLVMAETWVCASLINDKIETNVFKRVGNEFHWKINDELTIKYEIWYEDALQIKLIDTKKDDIGIGATLLAKTNPPSYSAAHLYSFDTRKWGGECEVVK